MGKKQPPVDFDGLLGERWGGIASALFQNLNHATRPQQRAMQQLMQFAGLLQHNLLPLLAEVPEERCVMRGCRGDALMYCMVCGNASCMAHLHISHRAEGICDQCVRDAFQRAAPRPKQTSHSTRDLRWARKALGVRPGASWDEVRMRFRQLAAQHHPDRAKNEKQRARSEEKMVELNQAFEILRAEYEREAA